MINTLCTIGYEGSALDDFIATLKTASIELLVDVRELPISRRKGFAKTALSTALNDNGIEYIHLKGLGDPKPGRDAAKAGNYELFRRVFKEHLKTNLAKNDLDNLIELSVNKSSCLMCYERDHKQCHRNIVAPLVANVTAQKIRHLGVKVGLAREQDIDKFKIGEPV